MLESLFLQHREIQGPSVSAKVLDSMLHTIGWML